MRLVTMDGSLRFLAVLVGYGLLFAGAHHISISHWAVFNGLRLAALLLLPYRYWPAVVLAEFGPLLHESVTCAEQNGFPWAVAHAIPGSLFVMPLVLFFRNKSLERGEDVVQLPTVLSSALGASLILTAWNFVTLSVTHIPSDFQMPPWETVAARWVIGNYLGILTVCPMLVGLYSFLCAASPRDVAYHIVRSRFFVECLAVAALIGGAVVLYRTHADANRQLAQIVLLAPVVAMALRHGWRGAAVGGFLASTAIVLMMPALYDKETLQAEVLIAFVMSTLLMLGARITVLSRRLRQQHRVATVAALSPGAFVLPSPPDEVMDALLAAADAVLERRAQAQPWRRLANAARAYGDALREAWAASRYQWATTQKERP